MICHSLVNTTFLFCTTFHYYCLYFAASMSFVKLSVMRNKELELENTVHQVQVQIVFKSRVIKTVQAQNL